jgi:uncharacterized membrane protein YkoI
MAAAGRDREMQGNDRTLTECCASLSANRQLQAASVMCVRRRWIGIRDRGSSVCQRSVSQDQVIILRMNIQPIHRRQLALFLLGLLTCWSTMADRNGHGGEGHGRHDHERAREALDRGEVRPIAEILAVVAREVPGEVVDVEFERGSRAGDGADSWIYELKILTEDGRVLEVLVDAATGRLLKVEED